MYLSGTSMATPYVAGVAALVASTQFGTTPQAIINRLYATADKINGTGNSGKMDAWMQHWQWVLPDSNTRSTINKYHADSFLCRRQWHTTVRNSPSGSNYSSAANRR